MKKEYQPKISPSWVAELGKKQYNAKRIKLWYHLHPEAKKVHNRYMSEAGECECGLSVIRSGMSRHRKTARHEAFMTLKLNGVKTKQGSDGKLQFIVENNSLKPSSEIST